MGYGDDLMATGMARGAHARGKRIAFGNRERIIWGPWSREIFRGNPNIAPPGSEKDSDIEWIDHYKGHRHYNRMMKDRWEWNYSFRPIPGEIFFTPAELDFAQGFPKDMVVIEPNVPKSKSVAVNKQWPVDRYERLAERLRRAFVPVAQLVYSDRQGMLAGARHIYTPTFRHALSIIAQAAIYAGPEGGLHHGAAAVNTDAVVIFGGFIPPEVTGYDNHINLFTGGTACGSLKPCDHCKEALNQITVDMVFESIMKLRRRK